MTAHRVEHVMGMPVTLALKGRHVHDELADAAWTAAVDLLRQVDRDFSTYREDSWISRLGRGEVGVEDDELRVVGGERDELLPVRVDDVLVAHTRASPRAALGLTL